MLTSIFGFKLATMDMPSFPFNCVRQVSAFYFPCEHEIAEGVWHGDAPVFCVVSWK
jgi:hypothetical protein